jgi:TM2 domain-containing membrane protein YozV
MTVALNSKSPAAAILLSLVFTGAGQWYAGRVGRGFAFFGAAVLSGILIIAVIGLILLPIVWVCAAIDANNCVRKYNAELMRLAGMAPVPPALNA